MAYAGSATSDDITFTSGGNFGNATALWMGWFRPDTLTAGRGYMSNGGTGLTSIRIGNTTSEVRITIDFGTTDGTKETSGAGITTGKWYFIAVLSSAISGAWAARCWIGTINTPPVEVSLTAVATASGTTNSNSSLVTGNLGTSGTSRFEGLIGCSSFIGASLGINNTIPITTGGTITQDEANYCLETLVRPFWQGRPTTNAPRGTTSAEIDYVDCENAVIPVVSRTCLATAVVVQPPVVTLNGWAQGEERCDAAPIRSWPVVPTFNAHRRAA